MTREVLPNRRESSADEVTHIWSPATDQEQVEDMLVTIGLYEDGRVGEVFINYVRDEGERKKADRVINLGHDVATIISIAIQYGAPIEKLRDAVGRSDVNYMGQVRSMPHTIVGTVLDHLLQASSAAKDSPH